MSDPDDQDRDDAEAVERMERGLPPGSEEEASRRAVYQRLIARLDQLDEPAPAPGWVERAVERWQREGNVRDLPAAPAPAPRRINRRRWQLAAALALGAVAAILVLRCGATSRTGVTVAHIRRGTTMSAAPAIGDELDIRVPQAAKHTELRVYRDRQPVARCPGDAACRVDARALGLRLTLDVAGRYEVIVLASDQPLSAPRRLDLDELDARDSRTRMDRHGVFEVR